jgi:rSAM/selenodomain-associated transferase 1
LRERLFLDTLDGALATELPVVVCFTPDDAREEMRRLAGDVASELVSQRGEDLGARMRHAMNEFFARGTESVVLIGSDLPSLPAAYILDAFAMLDSADVVLGPTDDGGFYLIGARREMPDILQGVDWSGANVCAAVVAAAHAQDLTIGFAREWWDTDRPEDLERLLTRSGASAPDVACGPATARRVREYLERDS